MPVTLINFVVHPLLSAVLPIVSNVAMPAERFGADNGASRIILMSTVLAFFQLFGGGRVADFSLPLAGGVVQH